MKILGVDPGLASIGWGIVEVNGPTTMCVCSGSLATQARQPLAERLRTIHDALKAIADEHQPQAAAVEEIFFAVNVKTAVAMAHARGAAILAMAQCGIELFEYSPLQIKQSVVGYGRASKDQVQMMVMRLLGLKEAPATEHAADALAAALCHAASLKRRKILEQVKS